MTSSQAGTAAKITDAGQPRVGALIRARRQQLRMTLQALADAAGISVGYVSQVERDLATPSLGTLAQIARSLDVGVDYFIATPNVEDGLSRAGQRDRFSVDGSSITYERIGADFANNVLSSFVLSIPPGYRSETVSHEGEEIVFMLEGAVTIRVGDDQMVLAAGDGLHFRGNRLHSWSNDTNEIARLLWTGTLPMFRSRAERPALRSSKGKKDKSNNRNKGETVMKFFKAALFAAVLAMPLASVASFAATPAGVLVVAQNIDDIVSIDPAEAYEFSSGEYVTQVYDRLVQYDAEDVKTLSAGLAASWIADDANKTLTFNLRDGVKFHSGNPLRAEDVVYSWKRVVVLNKSPAFILTQLGWTPENFDKMVTADGNKVVVKYTGDMSSAFVLNVLASRPASVVDAVTVAAHDVGGDMGNAWLKANSAGTGPFKLKTFRPAEILTLDANPDYFKGAPIVKQVIIRHVAEAATQQLLLTSGDVDMAKNLTPDQIAGLAGNAAIKVETYPQAAVHFLSFNQKTAALQPEAVWEAARYLVDYKGMTDSFLKGQMQIHQAFWPSGFPGALDDTPYSYNPDKAKQILADAGIKTPITVSLDVINSNPFTDMAQSLQASFAKGGINFNIIPGTGSQVITKYRARTHEAMLLYWGPDFMDPDSNAEAFAYNADNADGSSQSTTTWRNSWAVPDALNKATKAALAEADPAKRDADYIDLQKQVQAKSPIVIMFQAATQVAMSAKLSGYVNGATSDFVFYRLVKKD